MITLTDAEISLLLSTYLWPLLRITGFLLADPLYGTKTVPRRIKTVFAIALTVLIAPLLPAMPAIPVVSGEGFAILVQQLLIGLAMGFVMRIAITVVEMSGALASLQMGLGFAMFFDPQHGASVPALSRFLTMLVYLLFLAMDGHHAVLSALVDSFTVFPVALEPLPRMSYKLLAEWGGHIFSFGLLMAMPVVAALLITNLAIGVMTRAAPQFNIFTFGFPLTLMVGFVALYFTLPFFPAAVERLYAEAMGQMMTLLKVRAS